MIVENGTGIENANSYVDVVFADDYFSTRGYAKWETLEEATKEILLIKATDYINNAYKWNGKKLTTKQSLRFPRQNLVDYEGDKVEGVPVAIKESVCECAKLIENGVEMFLTHEASGVVTSERIGELSFTYDVSKAVKDCSLYESLNTRLRGMYEDTSSTRIVSVHYGRV